MTEDEARALSVFMNAEDAAYLAHFTPFASAADLISACAAAKKDRYLTLRCNLELVGFYMLRGWDSGYMRPSFGVYVAKRYRGRGIARFALCDAELVCRSVGAEVMMLKVSPENLSARTVYEAAGFQVLGTCPDTGHIMMDKAI